MRLLLIPKTSAAAENFVNGYNRWGPLWADDTWILLGTNNEAMWQAAKSEASVRRIPALTRSVKKLPAQVISYIQGKGIIIKPDDTIHDLLAKLTGNEDLEI